MPDRRAPLLLVIPLVALLAGCVPTTETAASPSPSASGSSSPSAPAPSEPSNDPVEEEPTQPLVIRCDELVSRQDMYEYSPQFALLDSFTPDSGSLAAEAVGLDGVACRWVNETSGETIDISAAQLLSPALTEKRSQLSSTSTPVPTFGDEGYFDRPGDTGTAQVVSGPYWITAVSSAFFEAGDAAPLLEVAVGVLGQTG
jgi:hypothetical protein